MAAYIETDRTASEQDLIDATAQYSATGHSRYVWANLLHITVFNSRARFNHNGAHSILARGTDAPSAEAGMRRLLIDAMSKGSEPCTIEHCETCCTCDECTPEED